MNHHRPAQPSPGFTLVEVVVSAVILVIFAMAGLAVGNVTIATLSQARSRAEASQRIQLDLEKVRQAALDFCRQSSGSGYGPTDASSGQACPSPFGTWVTNFTAACNRNATLEQQLGSKFSSYLQSVLPGSPITYQAPSGHRYTITRTLQVGSSPNGGSISAVSAGRTVTLSYTAVPQGTTLSLPLTSITITPNAVAWCPIQYV